MKHIKIYLFYGKKLQNFNKCFQIKKPFKKIIECYKLRNGSVVDILA